MKKKFISAIITSLLGVTSFASEWNLISSTGTDDALYFFDAESAVKKFDIASLWVKTVQKVKPDTDGSWSTAYNYKINCKIRTIQLLGWSSYDATGKFIESSSKIGQEKTPTPDSIGDGIYKLTCLSDFPRNTTKTDDFYAKVLDNDVFAATKRFVEYRKSLVDKAPK